MAFRLRSEWQEGAHFAKLGGRIFQREGTANAKTLGWERALRVLGTDKAGEEWDLSITGKKQRTSVSAAWIFSQFTVEFRKAGSTFRILKIIFDYGYHLSFHLYSQLSEPPCVLWRETPWALGLSWLLPWFVKPAPQASTKSPCFPQVIFRSQGAGHICSCVDPPLLTMWLRDHSSSVELFLGYLASAGPAESLGLGSPRLGTASFTAWGQHQNLQKAPKPCTSTSPWGAHTVRDFYKVGENALFCDTDPYIRA